MKDLDELRAAVDIAKQDIIDAVVAYGQNMSAVQYSHMALAVAEEIDRSMDEVRESLSRLIAAEVTRERWVAVAEMVITSIEAEMSP